MATLDDLEQRIAALEAIIHKGDTMTSVEPFDSNVVLTRNADRDYGRPYVTSTLAIEQEQHGQWSDGSPLFVEGHATDDPQANQGEVTAMDTTETVRGYAPGVGWDAALQVEEYHQKSGTSIALGIEEARTSPDGTDIALNIHNDPARSPAGDSDIAINIQNPKGAGFKRVINVEQPGEVLDADGERLIFVEDDGSIVIGKGMRASITIRPDGNVGIDCDHLWVNGKLWR